MIPQPKSIEALREQARSTRVDDRVALAENPSIPKELLFFLAADLAPEVRRRIAENGETPLAADLVLARDSDEDVRSRLVEKSAARVPGNDETDAQPVPALLEQVLEVLAGDSSLAVRKTLSLAIAELRHAPHSAISQLARDDSADVACPVLEASPILDQDDLIAAVERASSDAHLDAIAGRRSLPASVSHAIVVLGRDSSVRKLLTNRSAQVRESTLDLVLEQAPDHPNWHEPLATHPALPAGAADRLSCFLSQALIEVLDEAESERCALAPKIAERTKSLIEDAAGEKPVNFSEPSLRDLIDRGDTEQLAAGLAKRANLNYGTVCEILAAAAPRAVVALAWAADLSMAFAVSLQSQVARIPPGAMLSAAADGGYPLSGDELADQLTFFGGGPERLE